LLTLGIPPWRTGSGAARRGARSACAELAELDAVHPGLAEEQEEVLSLRTVKSAFTTNRAPCFSLQYTVVQQKYNDEGLIEGLEMVQWKQPLSEYDVCIRFHSRLLDTTVVQVEITVYSAAPPPRHTSKTPGTLPVDDVLHDAGVLLPLADEVLIDVAYLLSERQKECRVGGSTKGFSWHGDPRLTCVRLQGSSSSQPKHMWGRCEGYTGPRDPDTKPTWRIGKGKWAQVGEAQDAEHVGGVG